MLQEEQLFLLLGPRCTVTHTWAAMLPWMSPSTNTWSNKILTNLKKVSWLTLLRASRFSFIVQCRCCNSARRRSLKLFRFFLHVTQIVLIKFYRVADL